MVLNGGRVTESNSIPSKYTWLASFVKLTKIRRVVKEFLIIKESIISGKLELESTHLLKPFREANNFQIGNGSPGLLGKLIGSRLPATLSLIPRHPTVSKYVAVFILAYWDKYFIEIAVQASANHPN